MSRQRLPLVPVPPLAGHAQLTAYLTLPRQKVGIHATPVERDQQVGAAVAVGHGELRGAHLLAGRLYWGKVSKAGSQSGSSISYAAESRGRSLAPWSMQSGGRASTMAEGEGRLEFGRRNRLVRHKLGCGAGLGVM